MADEIETLLVAVRADTQLFARDVAAMKAELIGPFAAGAEQAGRMLENALVRGLELFVPTASGRIETAGGGQGRGVNVSITINAPAGSEAQALKASGRQVARAVRQALMRAEG